MPIDITGLFQPSGGADAFDLVSWHDVASHKWDATEPPAVTNDVDEGYVVGSLWCDVTHDKAYVCLDNTDGAAVWQEIGAAGAQGNQGVQGSQGVQGAQGGAGAQGNQGAQGGAGAQGNQGSQGNQGNQGAAGAQGNQGAQGGAGAQGAQGAQGAAGAQGAQGVQGATGGSTRVIEFVIDGGGSAITTGIKGDLWLPYACTLTAWRLLADQSGAIKIDVWKDAEGNYPPTDADTITNGHEPEIAASGVYAEDDAITDWVGEAIDAESTLRFNVDSCTTITRCTLAFKITVP